MRDLGTEQVHPGAPELVEVSCLSASQQSKRDVEHAGLVFGLRRRQCALRPARWERTPL